MDFKLNLHALLEPYRQEIEATLKPCIRIITQPGKTGILQSKFGGCPYIPLDAPIENWDYKKRYKETPFPYPRNKETGKELFMLAQINFEEMPALEFFPTHGLLQVFIDVNASGYGINDDYGHKIIYYPSISKDPFLVDKKINHLPDFGWDNREHALRFELDYEPVSENDCTFEEVYSTALLQMLHGKDRSIFGSYMKLTRGKDGYNKNKIGGYHYSQNNNDPKSDMEAEHILLIQFDGCDVFSWGDGGTACFFIKKEDLLKLDFSDVIYHWDST